MVRISQNVIILWPLNPPPPQVLAILGNFNWGFFVICICSERFTLTSYNKSIHLTMFGPENLWTRWETDFTALPCPLEPSWRVQPWKETLPHYSGGYWNCVDIFLSWDSIEILNRDHSWIITHINPEDFHGEFLSGEYYSEIGVSIVEELTKISRCRKAWWY